MRTSLCLMIAALMTSCLEASDLDEFKVKRESNFTFAQKPKLTRSENRVTISFETQSFCDVTVAIENKQGQILRHLASGVLGTNAPPPFKKGSKKQDVVWDGKDDRGVYIDTVDALKVRVSLGLKPKFNKTLYWSPHKQIGSRLLASAPEGVYVFEGQGVDHLRLFDHDGNYLRTVYPFPAGKIPEVKGLQTHTYPQDGKALPLKLGFEQGTLLTSGTSAWGTNGGHSGGSGASTIAVLPAGGGQAKIGLAGIFVNRLLPDGSSGGLPIKGPSVGYSTKGFGGRSMKVGPNSAAFSPDGKYMYVTGYAWYRRSSTGWSYSHGARHGVLRLEYAKQDKAAVFLGDLDKHGKGNDRFALPTSVACDPKGRVYVGDYCNSRIQVFSPEGKYLKTIPCNHPAVVSVDPRNGEIWVFGAPVIGISGNLRSTYRYPPKKDYTLAFLGTFEKPVKAKLETLPGISYSLRENRGDDAIGQTFYGIIDFYAKDRTIWMRKKGGILICRQKGGKWEIQSDFNGIAQKKVLRVKAPSFSRCRLLVNPANGQLYVLEEQTGADKSFHDILNVDTSSGKVSSVRLPFDTEDMIYDSEGLAYLKTDREIVRFNSETWREIVWDYGEERDSVRFGTSGSYPKHASIAALPLVGRRPVWYHSSGFGISPKRHLAVICAVKNVETSTRKKTKSIQEGINKKYTPFIFPGRIGDRIVFVFDKHGQVLHEDAVPGMTNADGIAIDNDDNLYVMVAAPRILDGKPYFNGKSETLMKLRPGKAKFISAGAAKVPLALEEQPKEHPDVTKYGMGKTWVQEAEWFYGGVGYGGQGGSCTCWHSRFQMDYFSRSFAPEVGRYNVAVLDSNGNLIMRIGRYGNVEDGKPLDPAGGPKTTRSIGGDEVALCHAAYVGVHSDRYLYIHDAGNGRILSVKLDYHTTELNLVPASKQP